MLICPRTCKACEITGCNDTYKSCINPTTIIIQPTMTNPTPEKLKQWEEAAKEYAKSKYPVRNYGDEFIQHTGIYFYLQGRQDEWRECSSAIQEKEEIIEMLIQLVKDINNTMNEKIEKLELKYKGITKHSLND